MTAEPLDSPKADAALRVPLSPFFSTLLDRAVAWLAAPIDEQDAHLAQALAITLLDRRATLIISGLSTLVAATAAWLMTGATWVIAWLLADLALSLTRVVTMEHARRNPGIDRMR